LPARATRRDLHAALQRPGLRLQPDGRLPPLPL